MVPDYLLEILFFITMILLSYDAVQSILGGREALERLRQLEEEVEELKKRVEAKG